LARIVEDLPLGIERADLALGSVDWPELERFAHDMGFGAGFARRARDLLEEL